MRYVRYNIIHIIELTQQPSNIEILIAILVHCADVLHLHRIILYHVYGLLCGLFVTLSYTYTNTLKTPYIHEKVRKSDTE